MFGHILILTLLSTASSGSKDVKNILGCTIVPLNHANSTCVNTDLKSFSFSTTISDIDLEESEASRITNLFLASEYMYYVPNNIFKFFPNVREIGIHTALPQLIKIEKQHFIGLTKLNKLFIVGQRLRHIGPDVFEGASAITDLFLPSNQIQSISELAFKGLTNCRHLMLNGNQIDKLKAGTFAPMPNLWSVNLSKNRLMILAEFTFASNKVTILDLSHNKIESIPEHIVTNFAASKDPKKLLSMRGNICDTRIYTKNSHRVDRILASCIKGSTFLPDSELIERLREDIKQLEQKNANIEHENHKLRLENDRLGEEIKKLESSASCNEEKCRLIFQHIWQDPFSAILGVITQINYWKEKSQSLFTTLATIHGDGTCVDPAPNVTKNDCADQKQLDLITSVEDRISTLMKSMRKLKGQNIALKELAYDILNNQPVKCPPIEECRSHKPYVECEICPETTTFGPFYCPEVVCPTIQCPPIKCPPCFGIKTTTELISTSPVENPCYEFMTTIETLEAELTILRAINNTYSLKTFKLNCKVEPEIEELDRIVLSQSIEIESLKKVVNDLTQSMVALRKEAKDVEVTAQRRLADNFNLKEDNADCASMRQIELIETTSKVSKTLLAEKERMLEKILAQLNKVIGDRDILKRRAVKNQFDFSHTAFDELTEGAAPEEAVASIKELSDALKSVMSAVKKKYKHLKKGDMKIQELVGEIAQLLSTMNRRGMVSNKIDQVNKVVIHTVSTLENIIQQQYDIMRKHAEQIENLITASITKIFSIFSRRSVAEDAKMYSDLLQPLNGLNKTLIEKDSLLRTQYDKIEKYISEIKESRVELEQAYEEYLANKKNVISVPQMDDVDDALEYMDDKMRACTDRTNKILEKTVVSQLTRIGVLREEVDTVSDSMERMKKLFKDLLKQCNHCRSFMSKGAGFFKKLFGKTSGCDFNAYEKKHLDLFNN